MLFTEDASYYAAEIKEGRARIKELVERALNNIEDYQEALNAVTHLQKEEALVLASEYEKHLEGLSESERQALPPFYGVPILLKELGHDQKGQPSDSSARLLEGNIASQTTNFTKSVEDAGFIVVGRTNTPEFGFKNLSDSDLHGPVHSPFDRKRNAGGSSGGAAAALKAGLIPAVTASDGGGSIRIPASFNGLIGLKPTRGRIAVGPGSYRSWQGASIDFVLTRSVRDTWEMLKALQVEQYDAPFVLPKIEEDQLTDLDRPLKIGWFTDSPIDESVDPVVIQSVEKVRKDLENLGHELTKIDLDIDGVKAFKSYYVVNCGETAVMMEDIEKAKGRPLNIDEMDPYTWGMFKAGQQAKATDYSRVLAYWDQLTAYLEAVFEEYDLILSPATNGPATVHGTTTDDKEAAYEKLKDIEIYPFEEQLDMIYDSFISGAAHTPYSQQANLTGTPALSLPLFEREDGLPIGSQFWTNKGNEYLLLQLAQQLEDAGLLKTEIFDPENQRKAD